MGRLSCGFIARQLGQPPESDEQFMLCLHEHSELRAYGPISSQQPCVLHSPDGSKISITPGRPFGTVDCRDGTWEGFWFERLVTGVVPGDQSWRTWELQLREALDPTRFREIATHGIVQGYEYLSQAGPVRLKTLSDHAPRAVTGGTSLFAGGAEVTLARLREECDAHGVALEDASAVEASLVARVFGGAIAPETYRLWLALSGRMGSLDAWTNMISHWHCWSERGSVEFRADWVYRRLLQDSPFQIDEEPALIFVVQYAPEGLLAQWLPRDSDLEAELGSEERSAWQGRCQAPFVTVFQRGLESYLPSPHERTRGEIQEFVRLVSWDVAALAVRLQFGTWTSSGGWTELSERVRGRGVPERL